MAQSSSCILPKIHVCFVTRGSPHHDSVMIELAKDFGSRKDRKIKPTGSSRGLNARRRFLSPDQAGE